ncbi:hypothetical protein ACQP2T_49205 [Nonomuraea sp. CA-143628]|uniref:hypothetical protein n=1 Tax=Nonomuraea sp. CA-143628 TaxID=3239997 RepID=UPI003D8A927D
MSIAGEQCDARQRIYDQPLALLRHRARRRAGYLDAGGQRVRGCCRGDQDVLLGSAEQVALLDRERDTGRSPG